MRRRKWIVLGIVGAIALFLVAVWILATRLSMERAELEERYRFERTGLSARETGIVKSCVIYAQNHGDHFPPHLAVLLLDGSVPPRALVINSSPRKPYVLANPPPPASDWRKIAADVDAHSDLVYTGADLTDTILEGPEATQIIAVYTRPMNVTTDGRYLGYADTHTEWVWTKDLSKMFAASNAARAKLGLPPFALDGPVPGPS